MATFVKAKGRGNDLFKEKRYEAALDQYGAALARCGEDETLERGTVMCNRAACFAALKRHAEARVEAVLAARLRPDYSKAASLELGDARGAERYARRAETLDPESKEVKRLVARCGLGGPGELYADRGDWALGSRVTDAERQRRDAKRAVERFKDVVARQGTALDAVFTTMIQDPRAFRDRVFPGVPPAQFDGPNALPATLAQLLGTPLYAEALERIWPDVEAKARSVLDGAKRRGAEMGEVMDAATEAELWPSVVSEAFARAIAPEVRRLAAENHATLSAERPGPAAADRENHPAPPSDPVYSLPPSIAVALSLAPHRPGTGVACVIDGFLGDDWALLVDDDCARLRAESASAGSSKRRLSAAPAPEGAKPRGEIAWLASTEIDEDFPALAELASRLESLAVAVARALTASVAATDDGSDDEPSAARVEGLLGGAAVPARLRGLAGAPQGSLLRTLRTGDDAPPTSDVESELRPPLISALYLAGDGDAMAHLDEVPAFDLDFVGGREIVAAEGGALVLDLSSGAGAPTTVVDHRRDRLVLWRSDHCRHSARPVTRGTRVSVAHWLYAAEP